MTENDVLGFDVAVDDFELVHQSQLLLQLSHLEAFETLHLAPLLQSKLNAVIVNDDVEAQIVFQMRTALEDRAYFEDRPLLYSCDKNLSKVDLRV